MPLSLLSSRVHRIRLPLLPDPGEPWKSWYLFAGRTADLRRFSLHVSTLAPGHTPHPPHAHPDETVMILVAGNVELVLPASREPLATGELHYIPADLVHTIETVGNEHGVYVVLKWLADPVRRRQERLEHARYTVVPTTVPTTATVPARPAVPATPAAPATTTAPEETRLVFEGQTDYLTRLHCHVTTLPPGGRHPVHVDAHEVALLVLEGELETLGERAGPHDVVHYVAGSPHGLVNPGPGRSRHVAFELHFDRTAGRPRRLARTAQWYLRVSPLRWTRRRTWQNLRRP